MQLGGKLIARVVSVVKLLIGDEETHFEAGVTLTSLVTSASLPPSRTTRLNWTLAARLVLVNGLSLAMTK